MDLKLNYENGTFDIGLTAAGDFEQENGLDTAVLLSLFAEGRSDNRGGWWGNELSEVSGFQLGSSLWDISRQNNNQNTRIALIDEIERALSWLVEDSVASSVAAENTSMEGGLARFAITINNFEGGQIRGPFSLFWDSHKNRVGMS